MKASISWLLALTALSCSAGSLTDQHTAMRAELLALGRLTRVPELFPTEGFVAEGSIRPVFFEGLPWKGQPTRVFAWLGLPAERSGELPGIVLVHGGGGTAFKEWVKLWNERGFAAISIAVEGQTDRSDLTSAKTESNPRGWERHAWAGPARVGIYGDSTEPLKDQWMYHAVADTVLANSLLRSLAEIDADEVGVMGISWGGVIVSTVIGLDSRFAFAIPTYGCGHLFDAENQYGRALGDSELYKQVWDPVVRLDRAQMPVLWFSWPEDAHFPLDCQAVSYRTATGPHMVTLIPGMRHGHGAAWRPPDSYAFAESVVREGSPWCRQIRATVEEGRARVEFSSIKLLDEATLISTTDTGVTSSREWAESPAVIHNATNSWLITAPLPERTTAWFVNVRSEELVASSDYQEQR